MRCHPADRCQTFVWLSYGILIIIPGKNGFDKIKNVIVKIKRHSNYFNQLTNIITDEKIFNIIFNPAYHICYFRLVIIKSHFDWPHWDQFILPGIQVFKSMVAGSFGCVGCITCIVDDSPVGADPF